MKKISKGLVLIGSCLLINSCWAAIGSGTKPKLTLTVTSVKSVYDGDTFRAYLPNYSNDQRVRVRGVDTPEIKGKCSSEKSAAIKARDFVRQHLKSATTIVLSDVGRDRYQRVLASVSVDGKDLAQTLINKNLGRKWRGKRESWCD